jgi:hypothetical protein
MEPSGQLHAQAALDIRLDGPQAVEKRKISCPWREAKPGHPARNLVAIPTAKRIIAKFTFCVVGSL